jgi:hypothetical protein
MLKKSLEHLQWHSLTSASLLILRSAERQIEPLAASKTPQPSKIADAVVPFEGGVRNQQSCHN